MIKFIAGVATTLVAVLIWNYVAGQGHSVACLKVGDLYCTTADRNATLDQHEWIHVGDSPIYSVQGWAAHADHQEGVYWHLRPHGIDIRDAYGNTRELPVVTVTRDDQNAGTPVMGIPDPGSIPSGAVQGLATSSPLENRPEAFMLSGGISSDGRGHPIMVDDYGRVICSPEH